MYRGAVRSGTLTPYFEEYTSVESRGAFATEYFFAEGTHYVFQVRPLRGLPSET